MTQQLLDLLQDSLSQDLLAFLPELILCGTIVLMLFLRLFNPFQRLHMGWVALLGLVAGLVVSGLQCRRQGR